MGSGLPERNILSWGCNLKDKTPEQITFSIFKTLEATAKIRKKYQYNTQAITLAGYMAACRDDPSKPMQAHYIDLMNRYVLKPLGMHRTSFKPFG